MAPDTPPVELAGEGTSGSPDVVFVHANGLCKETWRPVVSRIARLDHRAWRSVDLRGHGDSPGGGTSFGIDLLARDLVASFEGSTGVLGVGHSSGGAVVARAEVLHPGLFRHLVLIEPIIYPPPHRRWDDLPLATAAEKRRTVFATRTEAYDRFASGPFASWTPEALDAYVDYGFNATHSGLVLKCQPHVEADLFREGLNHDTWERAREIRVPVTIVAGETSDTHAEPYLSKLAEQFADVRVLVIEGAGHFVPMEQPETIAAIVSDALETG